MPVTIPCPEANVLRRLLLGELSPAELDPLGEHVLHCERCVGTLNGLRADDPLLKTLRGAETLPTLQPVVLALIERLAGSPASANGTANLAGAGPVEAETLTPREAAPATGASGYGFLAPPEAPDELGRLGGYRVLKLLGQGGMGAVFLAEDVQLERSVALKVMLPEVAAKPGARQRFLREARATAKLKDDHVVAIYQVGEDRGVPFLAMEHLQGESLEGWLKRGRPLSVAQILRLAREITRGLAAAHAKGLVHRDIKPANLWLEAPRGRVKILDFGLARGGAEEVQLTQAGAIVGTPAYMAPEQAKGEPADARSDLFSLGCVLYRLCTGRVAFQGPTVMAVLTALAVHDPDPVAEVNPQIPGPLAGLVMRLLAKRREDRPASARAVAEELAALPLEEGKTERLALPGKSGPGSAAVKGSATTVSFEPKPAPKPRPKAGRGRTAMLVALGLLALVPLGWWLAAVVFRVEMPNGTLIVKIDDPETEARVKNGKLVLTGPDGKARYTLAPSERNRELATGDYRIHVEGADGLTLDTTEFTLKQGEKVIVLVRAEARPVARKTPSEPSKAPRNTAAPSSPFDRLDRSAIPARELALAGEGDPAKAPEGLVGVLGEARLNHWRSVIYAGFRDDGKTLVTASHDGLVRWWDVPTKKLRRSVTLPGLVHSQAPSRWTFDLSPDGRLIALQENSGKLVLRRSDTFQAVKDFPLRGYVKFSPDGKTLAVVGRQGEAPVQLLNIETLTIRDLEPKQPGAGGERACPRFSPDGKTLALMGGGEARFYDIPSGRRIRVVPAPNLIQVVWHPFGMSLAAGDFDWMWKVPATIWDHEGKRIKEVKGLGAYSMATTPDGRHLVKGNYGGISILEWGKGDPPSALYGEATLNMVHTIGVSPRGNLVAAGGAQGGVCLVRLPGGKVDTASGREWAYSQVMVTPDGRQIVRAASLAKTLTWYRVTGPSLAEADRLETGVGGRIAFSPGGRWAAGTTGGGKFRVWDLVARTLHAEVSVPRAVWVDPGSLSAGGDRLALVREDRSTVVVDVPSGKITAELPAPPEKEGPVTPAISPDGRWVAVATLNPGRIVVYDARTGRPVREMRSTTPAGAWGITARWPVFTPDCKRMLCLSAAEVQTGWWCGGMLEGWDAETGRPLFSLKGAIPAFPEETGDLWPFRADRVMNLAG